MGKELAQCSLVQYLTENLQYPLRITTKSGKTITVTDSEITSDGYLKYNRSIEYDDGDIEKFEGILPLNRIELAEVELEDPQEQPKAD